MNSNIKAELLQLFYVGVAFVLYAVIVLPCAIFHNIFKREKVGLGIADACDWFMKKD